MGTSLEVAVLTCKWLDEFRKSKVNDLGVTILRHHDVGGLHISVNDTFFMSFGEPFGHIGCDLESASHGYRATGDDIAELFATDELHGDEGDAFDVVDLVNDTNVGMLELGCGFRFLDETALSLGISNEVLG